MKANQHHLFTASLPYLGALPQAAGQGKTPKGFFSLLGEPWVAHTVQCFFSGSRKSCPTPSNI